MKKITLLAMALCFSCIANAQEEEEEERLDVLYLELSGSIGGNIGLTYEYTKQDGKNSILFPSLKESFVFKAHYSATTLESNNIYIKDVDGAGWGAEIGSRM